MPTNEDQAPGLDAINQALTSFYGQKPDKIFSENQLAGTGASALESISVYRSQADKSHWHYITFGFSELFEKESENAQMSGLGFELTFRLVASTNENQAPEWPFSLLNQLAQMIFENGIYLQPGSLIELPNSIRSVPSPAARIDSVLIARDLELGTINTINGRVDFLQAVGITEAEVGILKRWRGDKFIESAKAKLGRLLLTDPGRESITEDPCMALKLEESITRDGTGDIVIDCPLAEWIFTYKASVSFGIDIVPKLKAQLLEGLSSNRDIVIRGSESKIVFRNGKEANFKIENDVLILEVTESDAQAFLGQLQAIPSSYSLGNLPVGIELVDAQSQGLMREMQPTPRHKNSNKKSRK